MIALLTFGVASVLLLDQLAKAAVARRFTQNEVGWRRSVVSLRRVTPAHATSRSARDRSRLLACWAIAVIGSLLYAGVALSSDDAAACVGLGCAIGGATSNLLDRLWRGGVVDYIAVGFWPVFNVADVAIVGGVFLALGAAG